MYIAHKDSTGTKIQTIKDHSDGTAKLCQNFATPELKDFCYAMGLLHDIGKYQRSFQRRITGDNIRVEHSTCGALAAKERYPYPINLMMEYCITGHHSGLPDGGCINDTADMPTLYGRMKRPFERFDAYKEELQIPNIDAQKLITFLAQNCANDCNQLIDQFAFLTRYSYSCLVDADSLDTADFCRTDNPPKRLRADFSTCLDKVKSKLSSFTCMTELQKARTEIQNQAFQNAKQDAEIYLMNMPTGSGKTLASIRIALERAIASGKKRIIYVIPYNSIIDQTAEVFENLFGNDMEILRHQSTFSYDEANGNEDYRIAAKQAEENWDAPCIITTMVQFFESIYSNKRGKLRKLHNMADSILVFDEIHLMSPEYLQPCLQSIAYITRYLKSEALFLTATMPDFRSLIRKYALPDSIMIDLVTDTSLFSVYHNKRNYINLGEMKDTDIWKKSRECPSSLIIVNTRKTARAMYQKCKGRKYHLSTYMTGYDRQKVLRQIRKDLSQLEHDYPDMENVPEDRRITIISTSLIEAGVDIDVHTVFREMAGLEHVLQSGGRGNREGKREYTNICVFTLQDDKKKFDGDIAGNLTRGLFLKYPDISAPECIREYYDRIFAIDQDKITRNTIHQDCCDLRSIPFQSYAEQYELINSKTVSLVVSRDEKSNLLVNDWKHGKLVNIRQAQNYTCTLYQEELDHLIQLHAVDHFGAGIYCLTDQNYYDENIGILAETL